jgi:hypothetical protein
MYTLHYQAHNYVFFHCPNVSQQFLVLKGLLQTPMGINQSFPSSTDMTEPILLIDLCEGTRMYSFRSANRG